jgi:hypothetical protein
MTTCQVSDFIEGSAHVLIADYEKGGFEMSSSMVIFV